MLKHGFKARTAGDEETERLEFYLELADSYDSDFKAASVNAQTTFGFYDIDPEPQVVTSFGLERQSQIRQRIAFAAFQALCDEFFRGDKDGNSRTCDVRMALSEKLFPKFLWFYRRTHGFGCISSNISPVSSKMPWHYIETALKFAVQFCHYAWDFEGLTRYHSDLRPPERAATHARLRKSLAEVVDLMMRLRILDFIATEQHLADEETFAVLERQVLNTEYHFPIATRDGKVQECAPRKPANLEELSIIHGELAAALLLIKAKHASRKNIGLRAKPSIF